MLWGSYDEELLETYKLVDETIGWVSEKAADATLVVMSDDGFARFDRAIHRPSNLGGEASFANVDWSRTRAYAVGLNSIYVNQKSGERDGIVAAGEETRQVRGEITERLLRFRDPSNGKPVVLSVAEPSASEDKLTHAPDLIVGYAPGYRNSWQSALGAIPGALLEDNLDDWRGDHCTLEPQNGRGRPLPRRPDPSRF